MALTLYLHPLASFCQKVLIALYENATPFEPRPVDLMSESSSAGFKALWPIARLPLLRDHARDRVVPESSIIIEYLAQHYPGPCELLPSEPEAALEVRARDRFYDLYVSEPMQKLVTDRLRAPGEADPRGVEDARKLLATSYAVLEQEMRRRTWAAGDAFSMADCSAAPALYYAELVLPFQATHPELGAYYRRLLGRPSFARAVAEAEPYRALFPAR